MHGVTTHLTQLSPVVMLAETSRTVNELRGDLPPSHTGSACSGANIQVLGNAAIGRTHIRLRPVDLLSTSHLTYFSFSYSPPLLIL